MDRGVVNLDGLILRNVHPESLCADRTCIVHSPTQHRMREWKLHWRDDKGIFERICPDHGGGHPDPDQYDYWDEQGLQYLKVHGCCGCCFDDQEVQLG